MDHDYGTCQTCFAVVLDDYYFEHQQWHEDNPDTRKGQK